MTEMAVMSRRPALRVVVTTPAAIDRNHLARMTFGDRNLERELVQLFARQASLLIERMRASEPYAMASLAHTLKGSAAGIGALEVAAAAQAVEKAATAGTVGCRPAIARLFVALDEACAAIEEILESD
jgi:HPt (histidine-containing phosphotransfer) domain-containing protein